MNRNSIQFWQSLEPEHIKANAFCRKLMGNRDEGDDLYQDSLVRALSGFETLKELDSFRPWLYRIIINTFKNHLKIPWYQRIVSITEEVKLPTNASNAIGGQIAKRRLEVAFKVLKAEDRALVILFELQGWKIAEIAKLTGLTEGNLKMKLSRARTKMRDALSRYFEQATKWNLKKSIGSEDEICVVTKPGKD